MQLQIRRINESLDKRNRATTKQAKKQKKKQKKNQQPQDVAHEKRKTQNKQH